MTDRPGAAEPTSESAAGDSSEPVVLEPIVVEPFVVEPLPREWPGEGLQDAVRLTRQAALETAVGLPPDEAVAESVQAFQEQRAAAQKEFADANEWLRAAESPIRTAESPAREFLSDRGLPLLAAGLQTGGIAHGGLAGYVLQSFGQALQGVLNAEPGLGGRDGLFGFLQIPSDAGNDPGVVEALGGLTGWIKELWFPLPVDEDP
jgi:hypothetical protein